MERKLDRAGGCWGKPTGRGNCPRQVLVHLCYVGTVRSNLKVRAVSHSGRFQRVGYTVGLWEIGSEQIGASVNYNGDGLSFKKLRSSEDRTWAWGMT